MTETEGLFPFRRKRVRMPLSDGHMDVSLSTDASPETVEALKQIGEAALAMMRQSDDPDAVECWINGSRFAHPGVKERMTGAQIRALPFPSIRDSDDLFAEVRGGQDVIVGYDETVPVAGRRFFSVPRFINAG